MSADSGLQAAQIARKNKKLLATAAAFAALLLLGVAGSGWQAVRRRRQRPWPRRMSNRPT